MNTKSKRKLPIGWRRLTPTEKITEECKYTANSNFTKDNHMASNLRAWNEVLPSRIGETVKQADYLNIFTYIKPIKQNETTKTEPNSNSATTSPTVTTNIPSTS